MTQKPIIHLVDDDECVLHSLSELVKNIGHECRCFLSAEAFLAQLRVEHVGCVITDHCMSGMDGLQLQQELIAKKFALPIIIVSGQVDVEKTVEFMENGAVTLLKNPYEHKRVIKAIDRALKINERGLALAQWIQEVLERIDELTDDEIHVMEFIVQGIPNKTIAAELKISMRTVDRRRSKVLEKMLVKSAPELAQLITRLRLSNGDDTDTAAGVPRYHASNKL